MTGMATALEWRALTWCTSNAPEVLISNLIKQVKQGFRDDAVSFARVSTRTWPMMRLVCS
jgi:hypothetical protein